MVCRRDVLSMMCVVCAFLGFTSQALAAACSVNLKDAEVPAQFTRLAAKQLALEYGNVKAEIRRIETHVVDSDVVRVDAQVQLAKPTLDNAASFWVTGWVNRCHGTLIMRGNTWLTDGTLSAPRYTREQLPGHGMVFGAEDAPINVIAFVDSRCPHCHRLIAYARDLLQKKQIRIEFRQVAYLETAVEAAKDARIFDTSLFTEATPAVGNFDYLDMLGELNSTLDVDTQTPDYEKALALLQTNTETAREVLHVHSIPAVLVQDSKNKFEYRLTGLAEMNRLFQPEL